MDYWDIVTKTSQLMLECGDFIAHHFKNVESGDVEEKSLNSLVSFVDREAEKQLVAGLSRIVPEAGFITEEDTIRSDKKDLMWVIDPLDGTTNFLNGVPVFCISIALEKNEETVVGLVYDVMHKHRYHAIKGGGAFLNDVPITVSDKPLAESLVATGFPYENNIDLTPYFGILEGILKQSRGIRRLGSAAIDLCLVAEGTFGAFYENFLNHWDLAAGVLIAREAGATVTDFYGDDKQVKRHVVAAGANIYPEIFKIIGENLIPGLTKIEHIGIAVANMAEAEKVYSDLLDTTPYKREEVASEHVLTSFFKTGPNKIELLEATDPSSAIARFLEKNRPGIHHIAFAVEDIYKEMQRLEALGFRLLNDTPKKGADNKLVCFIHPKSAGGVLVELCQEIKDT